MFNSSFAPLVGNVLSRLFTAKHLPPGRNKMPRAILTLAAVFTLSSLTVTAQDRDPRIPNVSIEPGYFLQALTDGLDFPTAVATSSDQTWISEAGFLPGFPPKIKEISASGQATTILSGTQLAAGRLEGPLTDVTFHDGMLWITHRQVGVNGWLVGAISKFDPDDPVGTFTTVITNLPSAGDHYTEEIVFDGSGRAYFSQGSATNSTVAGADNWFVTGWLQTAPGFHDFTPKDVVLNGTSFQTAFPFPLDPTATAITSPYMPFGSGDIAPGTVVHAATPATPQEGMIAGGASVYSFDPAAADPAGTLRLEGWGFRNPYGIGIDPFNPSLLFASNNGSDYRTMNVNGELRVIETRPIAEDLDDMFVMNIGGSEEFFGWPDLFHDEDTGEVVPVTDPRFCEQEDLSFPCPGFVLDDSFRNSLATQTAFAQFEEHSSANKFDFSTNKKFKHVGDIFVAETGSFVHVTGADEFSGYEVVRVDRATGEVFDFITHSGDTAEEILDPEGFDKPIDIKFRNGLMLIVDFGVFEPGLGLQQPGTGKLWLVAHGRSPFSRSREADR
jgi:glucose/arabinose dehydrogenase